ncbi:MAG: hypothetical protein WEC80_00870 [Patescibacteria group bacterium]
MKIVPAILTSDINSFWTQIERLLPFYNYFQIDIMDGTYGKNKTLSLDDILNTIDTHSELCKKIKVDFQLIVKNPKNHTDKLKRLKEEINIEYVFFHYKSKPKIEILYDDLGIKLGIAIDPDDSVAQLQSDYDISQIENVIIMTVFPRAQGQEFLEYPLEKIEQLRSANYRSNISLDGGINERTIPLIMSKKYLPDFLNIGSYFSKAENIEERIVKVKNLIKAT